MLTFVKVYKQKIQGVFQKLKKMTDNVSDLLSICTVKEQTRSFRLAVNEPLAVSKTVELYASGKATEAEICCP